MNIARLSLALGLLLCTLVHGESDNSSALRGGTETSRDLSGIPDGGVTIDFDDLSPGDYVSDQYSKYGLTLSAMGGCCTLPRIFDTSNPVTGNYGDIDLGSPNEHCKNGGPGWGKGGEPGEPGENCVPLHNVLIIQEQNDNLSIPDDEMNGGKIVFEFDPPAPFVYSMGFLDNDYGGKLIVRHGAGQTTTIPLPTLGDNAFETVDINLADVSKITFDVERSGAVAFISFVPPEVPPIIIEVPYFLISIVAIDTCFDPYAWCETELFDILLRELEGEGLSPEEFDVILNGLQAYYCDGAASAVAAAMAVVRGEGKFKLKRSGCCGNVSEIYLDVGLDTATLALAAADAYADAYAGASAYAFAKAKVCSKYKSDTLKYKLCALAKGEAESEAIADASATGSGTGAGSTSTSTDVEVFVDADKIHEFRALVSTSASSFASADASAKAYAYALAYAEALAKVKVSAKFKEYYCCRHKKRVCKETCRWGKCKCEYYSKCMGQCDWWGISFEEKLKLIVERISYVVEESYAEAYASALASISVKMDIPAYFKDLPGFDDIIMFDADLDFEVDVSTQCFASTYP